MRIITLNTWGGRALHPLMHFFRKRAPETDVFCLQEIFDADQAALEERHPDEHVRGDLFRKISAELRDFEGSFASFDDNPLRQSLAVFVRRTVPVRTISDFIVFKPVKPQERGSHVISSRKLQTVTVDFGGKDLMIANFHGLWNGGPKTDTPERLEQSRRVREVLEKHAGPSLLCGDFNLLPETESVAILDKGMCNLVRDHRVKSTRTPLYRHYENPDEPNFADYILTSPDLKVKRFQVLPDIVSDHAPLYAEIC
ncbi:MAG: endonuclease/exonuclease/phosphatase family protein [Patescibacteria group bacterium]